MVDSKNVINTEYSYRNQKKDKATAILIRTVIWVNSSSIYLIIDLASSGRDVGHRYSLDTP